MFHNDNDHNNSFDKSSYIIEISESNAENLMDTTNLHSGRAAENLTLGIHLVIQLTKMLNLVSYCKVSDNIVVTIVAFMETIREREEICSRWIKICEDYIKIILGMYSCMSLYL